MTEREIFQNEVVELSKVNRLLAIEACTGVGKGLSCFRCIEADTSTKKWLVVVPEILQIENLKNDIQKHKMTHIYDKIEDIICYASFSKYEGKSLSLWFNEVHRLSELKSDISSTINFDKIIVDSATIPFRVKDRLKTLGKFHYYQLTLQQAIDKGIIPEPIIYKISIQLDDKIKRNTKKFGKNTALFTDKAYAERLDLDLQYWKERFAENPKDSWITGILNKTGGTRKAFYVSKKTEKLTELLEYLGEKRLICYTGSIEQSDLLGRERAIHSKKKGKHNINTLNSFNNKEISSIFMNKMGREGLNLTDIEAVIITQLGTGNDEGLEFLQSFGRSLRGINPEAYILYCKGTKDEKFLDKALSHINSKYIKEWKNIH